MTLIVLLTPISIILISLVTIVVTTVPFVGLGFFVVSIWLMNVKNIMRMRASEEEEVGMGSETLS